MLNGPITDRDWSRFDAYANRVRDLTVVSEHHRIHAAVYLEISQSRKTLCPALRNFKAVVSNDVPELILMWSPLLRKVTINVMELAKEGETAQFSYSLNRFLNGLGRHAPDLQDLTILGSFLASPDLTTFRQLRSIDMSELNDCSVFTFRMFGSMSHIQNLARLYISLDNLSDIPEHPIAQFDFLEDLYLLGPVSSVTQILELLAAPRLRELAIDFRTDPLHVVPDLDNLSVKRCFEALASHCLSLRVLGFQAESMYPSLYDRFIISPSSLRPLFALQKLTDLDFDGFPLFSISDNDVATMALSWPNISNLKIPNTIEGASVPTFVGLRHLSSGCPNLQTLEMSVDTVAPLSRISKKSFSTHKLKEFHPQLSVIGDTTIAARYLDQIFPNLRKIHPTSGKYGKDWKEVDKLIRRLVQPAREDQRRRDILRRSSSH